MTDRQDTEAGEYDKWVDFTDGLWGHGFLAPGGAENVRRTVDGLDLAGRSVLDFGCGGGGPALVLAGLFGAKVTAVDVDGNLVARARANAEHAGLSENMSFRTIEPGSWPFGDESFDVVYSSGVFIHVADKPAAFGQVKRLLKPGGWFAAYDWLKGPAPESEALRAWIESEGLSFHMDHQDSYERSLIAAGFESVSIHDCSRWYREEAARELDRMNGEMYDWMTRTLGADARDHALADWQAMIKVLDSGELRMSRWRCRKPG